MTTLYSTGGRDRISRPTTRYSTAAELIAAVRAAAETAPEFNPATHSETRARYVRADYPDLVPSVRDAGDWVAGSNGWAGQDADGEFCPWPMIRVHAEMMGPLLPMPENVRVEFCYSVGAVLGSITSANLRPGLLALADKLHRGRAAFDGKSRRPARPGVIKGSSPHVTARAMIEADPAGALTIAEAVGAVFFGRGPNDARPFEYMQAEPAAAAGHDWIIGRAIRTGRFRVLHARSGLAADPSGFTTFSAALDWLETSAADDAWRDKVATALKGRPDYSQIEARAAYLARVAPDADAPAGPVTADPGAPDTAADVSAPVDPIDAPAADPAPRYSFGAHLIGTDSRRIDSIRFECAGPGLTSADIERAQNQLRELAAARGLRVVSANFGDSEARAWCEPIPAAPVNPGPAASGPAAPGASDAHRAPLNIALAAMTLARLSATYAPDSTRAAAIVSAGRIGAPSARETIGRYLSRIAHGGTSLERREASAALDLIEPARAASGPGIWPIRPAHNPAELAAAHPDRARALAGLTGAPVGPLETGPGAEPVPLTGHSEPDPLTVHSEATGAEHHAAEVARISELWATKPGAAAELRARAANMRAGVAQNQSWPGAVLDSAAWHCLARAAIYCEAAERIEAAELASVHPGPRTTQTEHPAAAPMFRYAMVNRPAHLGAIPRGLDYSTEPRPAAGAAHHETARHGVLCTGRELTAEECSAFELLPMMDGPALDAIAQSVAADLADYAANCIELAAEDPEEFARAVHQSAARGPVRVSIGDPAALVSAVLALLRAMVPADVPPATHSAPPATHSESEAAQPGPFDSMSLRELRAYVDGHHSAGHYDSHFERAARELNEREAAAGLPPMPPAPRARCSAPNMAGPVYRVHCNTYSRARVLMGAPAFRVGHGFATIADERDPLVTFRAFAEYRTAAANGLRSRVACQIRAERAARDAKAAADARPTAPHSYARLRAIHDRINATRAIPTTSYGRRWMRIMNRLRTLMHEHSDRRNPPATPTAPATPTRELSEPATLFLREAIERVAGDPRPAVALRIMASEYRTTARSMADQLAAGQFAKGGGRIPADYASAWAINGPAKAEAADALDAQADSIPEPAAPMREHVRDVGASYDVQPWIDDPSEYLRHVLECVRQAKAAGLSYNADTWPRAAALMAARFGYPDVRDGAADNGVAPWFGTLCYTAGKALDVIERRAANREAVDRLKIGQTFPRLIFSGGENVNGARVESFSHTGETVKLSGRRGGSAVSFTCEAAALFAMQERAIERAAHRNNAKPKAAPVQPIAAADVAPPAAYSAPPAGDSQPMPAFREARTAAVLDKPIRCDGVVMTRRAFVEAKVREGLRPTCTQEDRIQPMTRMQFFRASNAEQREHEARIKAAGKKDVFYIGGFEVTKTEHDYAAAILSAISAPAAPIDAAALILARVTACGSALTAAGLAHYVPELAPLGLDVIEREARALVAAGKLGEFDYSAQGKPSAFYFPVTAWKMTRAAYMAASGGESAETHRASVEGAIAAGRPVPADVLAEHAATLREQADRIEAPNPHRTAQSDETRAELAAELREEARAIEAAPAPRRAPLTLAQCHHAARGRPSLLRIPGGDPRARIPAQFAPVYLLQA